MLYLSQFLSTDVQKKGAQSGVRQLLPLSMSKKSRQKMKTSPKKNWFWPLKRGVGGGVTSTFWSKLKTNIPNGLLMARFPIKSGVKVDFGAPFDFFFFSCLAPKWAIPAMFPHPQEAWGWPNPQKVYGGSLQVHSLGLLPFTTSVVNFRHFRPDFFFFSINLNWGRAGLISWDDVEK